MPNILKDLTGKVFGRLLVLNRAVTDRKATYWDVVCDCGILKTVRGSALTGGGTVSCGCLQKELAAATGRAMATGNKARIRGTLEYFKTNTWGNLQQRTINGARPNVNNTYYLKAGIELRLTKDEFYAWCDLQSANILRLYSEGLTPSIDRVDPDGHYVASNIRILSTAENKKLIRHDLTAATEAKFKSMWLILPDGREDFFPSFKAAAKAYGLLAGKLGQVARGERKHHFGFGARYNDRSP